MEYQKFRKFRKETKMGFGWAILVAIFLVLMPLSFLTIPIWIVLAIFRIPRCLWVWIGKNASR